MESALVSPAPGSGTESSIVKDEKPTSPFRCLDSEIYLYRDIECLEKEKIRAIQQNLKVFEKTTISSRARSRKTYRKLEEAIERETQGNIEKDTPALNWALAFAKCCQSDKQSITDYISEQKELFLLEYAVKIKQRSISNMEKMAAREERKAKMAETKLEEDTLAFEEFLKENDRRSVDALKLATQEAKAKMEVMAEVKSAMNEVFSLKSEITETEDLLKLYVSYEAFLLSISPKEWQEKQLAKKKKKKKEKKSGLSKSYISVPSQEKHKLASTSFLLHHRIHKWAHSKAQPPVKGLQPGKKSISGRSASMIVPPQEEKKKSIQSPVGDYSFFRKSSRAVLGRRISFEGKKYLAESNESERSMSLSSEEDFSLDDIHSDEEPEIYFKDPKELLQIYRHLEEQNLSLFQNIQEISGTLEDGHQKDQAVQQQIHFLKDLTAECRYCDHNIAPCLPRIILLCLPDKELPETESQHDIFCAFWMALNVSQQDREQRIKSLVDEKEALKVACAKEEAKSAELELKAKLFATRDYNSAAMDKTLNSLTKKVAEVYKTCCGPDEVSSLSPFQMLKVIEIRVSELCEMLETLPKEYMETVEATEKLRAKERRQRVREDKLKELKRIQEERVKNALERAIAAPKKRVGRKLVHRSQPPKTSQGQETVIDLTTKSEDDYYFT